MNIVYPKELFIIRDINKSVEDKMIKEEEWNEAEIQTCLQCTAKKCTGTCDAINMLHLIRREYEKERRKNRKQISVL